MRRAMLAVSLLCVLVLSVFHARAQSTASPRTAYETQAVVTPDGGVLPITLGGERIAAEVTGPAGDPVAVSGNVGLNSATLAALAGPTCVPSDVVRRAVTATPTIVPVLSVTRTAVTIRNVSNGSLNISCRPDISGLGDLPNCTTPGFGFTLNPSESVTFAFRDSITIRCRTCPSGNGIIEHMEVSCTG